MRCAGTLSMVNAYSPGVMKAAGYSLGSLFTSVQLSQAVSGPQRS